MYSSYTCSYDFPYVLKTTQILHFYFPTSQRCSYSTLPQLPLGKSVTKQLLNFIILSLDSSCEYPFFLDKKKVAFSRSTYTSFQPQQKPSHYQSSTRYRLKVPIAANTCSGKRCSGGKWQVEAGVSSGEESGILIRSSKPQRKRAFQEYTTRSLLGTPSSAPKQSRDVSGEMRQKNFIYVFTFKLLLNLGIITKITG